MEEGDPADLVAFEAARRHVEAGLARPVFDEAEERTEIRGIRSKWEAAVRQLIATPAQRRAATGDGEDPEDVFEGHVNAAIGAVEGLVQRSPTR